MLTEENFIDFKCPHCGDAISFPQNFTGQAQACPICDQDVIVIKDEEGKGLKLPFPMELSTIILRRLSIEDWKDVMEIFGEEEFYTISGGHPFGEEEMIRWLESEQTIRLSTPGQMFYLGIQSIENNRLIGITSMRFIDDRRLQADLAVKIIPAFQRKGFATEALSALLHFCFDKIHLHRAVATCDSQSIASWRLLDTVGMRREGECVKDCFENGKWRNTLFYALLREEYEVGEQTE